MSTRMWNVYDIHDDDGNNQEDDNEYDPAIYDDDDNGSADDINSRTKMKGDSGFCMNGGMAASCASALAPFIQ